MTKSTADMAPKAIKAAIAIVLLVVVLMVVVSYYGGYRSAKSGAGEAIETTASADATASGEATPSPEGGEGEAQASNGTVVVLIDGLNFRTEPSKGGDLIKGLDEGTKLTYIETTEGWYKVETPDGKVGYVSASAQYTELQK